MMTGLECVAKCDFVSELTCPKNKVAYKNTYEGKRHVSTSLTLTPED